MKLVTFEGFDCTGKTSCSLFLTQKLKNLGFKVYFSREPFGADSLQYIRKALLKADISPITQSIFFIASRFENIQQIATDKENYDFVIFDRFADSTIAYQAYGMGCDKETIKNISKILKIDLEPEITFLMEFSRYEEFENRINERKEKSKYELMGRDFYEKVIEGYNQIVEENKSRFVRVNSIEKNIQECYNFVWSSFCKKFDLGLC